MEYIPIDGSQYQSQRMHDRFDYWVVYMPYRTFHGSKFVISIWIRNRLFLQTLVHYDVMSDHLVDHNDSMERTRALILVWVVPTKLYCYQLYTDHLLNPER
jgi:hypothetical protein